MTGVRLAAPLQVLREGHAPWAVGVLLGLFAVAPMLIAFPAGRHADRRGYHAPMRLSVVLTVAGGVLAFGSTWFEAAQFAMLCFCALLSGAGATYGMIAIQRTAGRSATGSTELKRVFSWLGIAPAISNVVGPVLAGVMMDWAGLRSAYLVLTLMPLLGLVAARWVAQEPRLPDAALQAKPNSWDLLRVPGVRRLLFVNLLLSTSWDVHAFVVPILGHERAFSASAIGLILGAFAAAVTLVRLLIPVLAHHLPEAKVLVIAMLCTALVLGVYPLVQTAGLMGLCAALLGLALGTVQPMILSALHQLTPRQRHGEVIALRTMTIGLASAAMPLLFGVAGAAVGAASLFWATGAVVALGSAQARAVGRVVTRADSIRT
jgi:MFS family permease